MSYTSSTRTRRGGSCLRFDYKTLFIYRTCTRRAPCVLASRQLVALLLAKNVTACDHCGAQRHETCTAHLQPALMSNLLISSDICPITSTHLIFPTHREPDSFFVFAAYLGVGNAFGPRWHERVSFLLNP